MSVRSNNQMQNANSPFQQRKQHQQWLKQTSYVLREEGTDPSVSKSIHAEFEVRFKQIPRTKSTILFQTTPSVHYYVLDISIYMDYLWIEMNEQTY